MVAPGIGVRPARHAQQPILPSRVDGTDRPVLQRGDNVGNRFGGPDSRCDSVRVVGRHAQALFSESLGVVPIRPGLVEAQHSAVVELPLSQSRSIQADSLEPYQELMIAACRLHDREQPKRPALAEPGLGPLKHGAGLGEGRVPL